MILLPLMILYSFYKRDAPDPALIRRAITINLALLFLSPTGVSPVCRADEGPAAVKPQVMREGTRIPPTTGRIEMLGRRWVFVPVRVEDQQFRPTAAAPAVQRAFRISPMAPKATRLGQAPGSRALVPFRPAAAPMEAVAEQPVLPFGQILLQENLMLQRIVEAIQEDPTDDHWIVSGEVTEFFNENRLTIQVAQRANRR